MVYQVDTQYLVDHIDQVTTENIIWGRTPNLIDTRKMSEDILVQKSKKDKNKRNEFFPWSRNQIKQLIVN